MRGSQEREDGRVWDLGWGWGCGGGGRVGSQWLRTLSALTEPSAAMEAARTVAAPADRLRWHAAQRGCRLRLAGPRPSALPFPSAFRRPLPRDIHPHEPASSSGTVPSACQDGPLLSPLQGEASGPSASWLASLSTPYSLP